MGTTSCSAGTARARGRPTTGTAILATRNLMMISILSVEVSTTGIWVSIVSMVGIAKGMTISIVGKSVSVSVASVESISISLGLSSGSGLGISGPLAIVMSIVAGIWVSIVSMVGIAKMSISIVTIEVAGISRCV